MLAGVEQGASDALRLGQVQRRISNACSRAASPANCPAHLAIPVALLEGPSKCGPAQVWGKIPGVDPEHRERHPDPKADQVRAIVFGRTNLKLAQARR